MKKIIPLVLVAVMAACLTGCTTTRVEVTPDMGPVAIMSINISNNLGWEGEEKSVGIAKFAIDKSVNQNGDEDKIAQFGYTKSLFDDAVAAVYNVLNEDCGVETISEDQLFSVNAYANAYNDYAYTVAYDQPSEYRALSYQNYIYMDVAAETGANSFMYITFDVCKVIDKGVGKNGSCKGSVTCYIVFCDANGVPLAKYYGYARTAESVASVLGVVNEGELMPYIEPVFREAFFNAVMGIEWKK